jgi:hypothetical protein
MSPPQILLVCASIDSPVAPLAAAVAGAGCSLSVAGDVAAALDRLAATPRPCLVVLDPVGLAGMPEVVELSASLWRVPVVRWPADEPRTEAGLLTLLRAARRS